MITIQELAAAVNVSKTTVSYVFSPRHAHLISPATRSRVLEAAQRLGYRPSYLGKALSNRRSYNIGLLLPAGCAYSMSQHILSIFHGIAQSSENSEYNLSIFLGKSKHFSEQLDTRRLDGVLAIGRGADPEPLLAVAAGGLPLVVVNRSFPTAAAVGCVRNDFGEWFGGELRAFRALGCRRVLVLNQSESFDSGREFARLAAAAREEVPEVAVECRVRRRDLAEQCRELLESSPRWDAFLLNGNMSDIFCRTARAMGLRPGGDFQISGFLPYPRSVVNGGRIWSRCGYELGRQGWRMLTGLIDGSETGRELLVPLVRPTTVSEENRFGQEPDF